MPVAGRSPDGDGAPARAYVAIAEVYEHMFGTQRGQHRREPTAPGMFVGHAAMGKSAMALLVRRAELADNLRARAFYEHHGWLADGARKIYELAGERYPEVRYRRGLH